MKSKGESRIQKYEMTSIMTSNVKKRRNLINLRFFTSQRLIANQFN